MHTTSLEETSTRHTQHEPHLSLGDKYNTYTHLHVPTSHGRPLKNVNAINIPPASHPPHAPTHPASNPDKTTPPSNPTPSLKEDDLFIL